MSKIFDVLIIGAGPAGTSLTLCLAKSELKIAVIDKASFPREKICGDGLTHDVIRQLPVISESLFHDFMNIVPKKPSFGAEIISPAGKSLHIPFFKKGQKNPVYICKRSDFDNLLFRQLQQFDNVSVFENCIPEKITRNDNGVEMVTNHGNFHGKIIVGADGVNSFVARHFGIKKISREQQCVTLRTYYKGLTPVNEGNPIEMYFLKRILPGYLWIFHLPNGVSNIGLGILATQITRKKITLRKCFEDLLSSEPLKARLEGAKQIEPVKGYIIPLGGESRSISGNRFLIVGDAAGLVDPFTGEGVGNAIRSGRVAADHILNCFSKGDFSAAFNQEYDKEIYRRMMPEFRFHSRMRNVFKHSSLINILVGIPSGYSQLQSSLQKALMNLNASQKRQNLLFILRIIQLYTIHHLFVILFKKKK